MTEEEAKKKQCCGPPGCGQIIFAANIVNDNRLCIGSACMAWRWTRDPEEVKHNATMIAQYTNDPAKWPTGCFWSDEPAAGHCGLAGRP